MPKVTPNKRLKTKHPGLYRRIKAKKAGKGTESVYYARIKQDGKWRELSLGRGLTVDEANRKRIAIIEGEDLAPSAAKEFTLEAMLEAYGGFNGNRTDISRYNKFLLPYWQNRPLNKIKASGLRTWLKWLRKQNSHRGGELSDQTIKHCMALLRRILRYSEINMMFPVVIVNNETTEDFTPAEIQAIRDASLSCPKDIQDILKIVLMTGMRRGEVLNLKWKDIRYDHKKIRLRNPKSKKKVRGSKNYIDIPLSLGVGKVLRTRFKGKVLNLESHVFAGKFGGRRDPDALSKTFRRMFTRAGITEGRTLHALRHWYASELLERTGDLKLVSEMLTHSDVGVTQRYAKVRDQKQADAAEIMNL